MYMCTAAKGEGIKEKPKLKITSVNAYHLKPERVKKKYNDFTGEQNIFLNDNNGHACAVCAFPPCTI